MRRERPSYKLTNTSWEHTKVIWRRWALGDNIAAIKTFLELNKDKYTSAPQHRDTISKTLDEFASYPKESIMEFVMEYPDTKEFVISQRPDVQSMFEGVTELPADSDYQEGTNTIEASLRLQHDRSVFIESETILTEKGLDRLLDRLLGFRFYTEEAVMLYRYLKFFDMESNKYIIPELRHRSDSCYRMILRLYKFFSKHCDIISDFEHELGIKYKLYPGGSASRFYKILTNDKTRGRVENRFDKKVERLVEECRDAYKAYRAIVRETLIL